uniref:Uncharacterized protein n=1 Tax=Ixodes ricinus TaxID=34613 RepID=A0A6B0V4A9_IXORI
MTANVTKLLKNFKQEMRDMKAVIERELKKEYKDLKSPIDFRSQQFDGLSQRCSKIEKENAALKKANAALSVENYELSDEYKLLREQLESSERRLTDLEQYSRNRNIEIKGPLKSKNLPAALKTLGDVIGEQISKSDIDVYHRVPRKDGRCPNTVVQFHFRAKRDAVIQGARKKRVCTSDLGLSGRSPVYVNDHLCLVLKKLLGQVIA